MEKARCLYAFLTETFIDFGSLATSTMMLVGLIDWGIALPYEALITQITEHVGVPIKGLRELQLEKGPIGACFLNLKNAHLWEVE